MTLIRTCPLYLDIEFSCSIDLLVIMIHLIMDEKMYSLFLCGKIFFKTQDERKRKSWLFHNAHRKTQNIMFSEGMFIVLSTAK